MTTFESDFEELIRYVKNGAANARVIVIGEFWDEHEKDNLKQQACNAMGVDFILLDEINWKKEYLCGLNTTVYNEEGNPHTVEHEGVAKYPNDKAMGWIAEKIKEKL